MSPLPPDVPPQVGPQFTRVAQEHLKAVEKQKAVHYGAELAKAKELGLEGPPPQHIMRAAGDALEALDRSGLDPTVRDGARKVLESVRDLDVGRLGRRTTIGEGGRIEGAVTKEPLEGPVTYADYDAWRQKLQEYAPGFAKLGQAQSQSKGSVGHVLGLIDEEMGQLARGTDVETLHRAADDFFVHEVQPARAVAKQVLRGEIEPNTLVDALTGKAHQQKFARYLKQLDDTAPGQALAFRQVKTQNMIERASRSGTFDPEAFLAEFNKMPTRTREALMHGTNARELRELFGNIDQAKALARTSQADTQIALDTAHADAVAAHEAAAADFTAAVAKGKEQQVAYRTAREHAKAQDPVLVSARRKLASQQMLMEAPADVLGGVLGLKAVMQTGNVYPLFNWLGGGSGVAAAHRLMSTILSTPNAPRALNRLFRLAASGASESVKARVGAQFVAHFVEGTGREIMNR